jgi:hypothetical protein
VNLKKGKKKKKKEKTLIPIPSSHKKTTRSQKKCAFGRSKWPPTKCGDGIQVSFWYPKP